MNEIYSICVKIEASKLLSKYLMCIFAYFNDGDVKSDDDVFYVYVCVKR